MSAIQSVSAFSSQDVKQAQLQLSASRNDTTRQANNVAQVRSTASEEATESAAERASEGGAEGGGLNLVA